MKKNKKIKETSFENLNLLVDSDIALPKKINFEYINSLKKKKTLNKFDGEILEIILKNLINNKFPYTWAPQLTNFVDFCPENQLIDYLIYRYKFQILTKQPLYNELDVPIHILVEINSACNLRCPMCFQSDKSFTRKPYMGIMKFDLFKKIIDDAQNEKIKALTFAVRGEPTSHPNFDKFLKYASNKFFEFKMNTNATYLNEEKCHQILSSSMNIINFSIDAHLEKIYEKVRVGAKFKQVVKNLKLFKRIKNKFYKNSKIITRVSGILYRKDQRSKKFKRDFKNFWSKYVDEVGWANMKMQWDTYNNKPTPELSNPCHFLWDRMYIWYDGTVNPCELDYKSTLKITNIKNKKIRDIWNSKEYKKIRQIHLLKERNKLNPCDRCGNS